MLFDIPLGGLGGRPLTVGNRLHTRYALGQVVAQAVVALYQDVILQAQDKSAYAHIAAHVEL